MRKSFGAKPFLYPQGVFVIASYNEDGSANAMNAAWGCVSSHTSVALFLDPSHKSVKNIRSKKAFTLSIADEAHIAIADYVGLVTGNNMTNKVEQAGLHTHKSAFVDAPMIEEFPLTLECTLQSYDEESECLMGTIVNVSADETILDEQGLIDPSKLKPITFDPVHNAYWGFSNMVGHAFKDGLQIKNK